MTVVEDVNPGALYSTRLFFYPLVLLATGLWLLYRWQQQSKLHKLGNKLPGPLPIPLFGNALLALGKKPEGKTTSDRTLTKSTVLKLKKKASKIYQILLLIYFTYFQSILLLL